GLAVLRQGGVGEVVRPGPAADGDGDLQIGVDLLELAQLVEAAAERLAGVVGGAADALLCGVGPPVVGERLALALGVGGEAAAVLVRVGEGVVEVGEPLGLPGGLQRLGQAVLVVGAPLGEVADLAVGVLGAAAVARRAVHRAG